MKAKVLFLTPGGTGGIKTQVNLLSKATERAGAITSVFETTKRTGASSVLSAWRVILFLCKMIAMKPNVVYIPLASRGSFYRKLGYASLVKLCGKPFYLHLHGGGLQDFYNDLGKGGKFFMKRLFKSAEEVLVLSEGQKKFAESVAGKLTKTGISVFSNGVELPPKPNTYEAPLQNENIKAIFIGDVKVRKGVDCIINLADFFADNGIEFSLIGKPDQEVLEILKTKNIESVRRLNFLGLLTHEEAMKILAQSHVLVLPSRIENFPNVLLESMSYGVPIIASDVGAIREIVGRDESGWLLNSNSNLEDELLRVFKEILMNKAQLNKVSAKARSKACSEYDIEILGRKFKSKVENLLNV